ncbi:MAG: sulfatase-like hydrolase/transferase [Gammaproteobacteria bacterium]|nr:sulfatase-like hydrolase/transferase [Gammaproteobacteria bacterium]
MALACAELVPRARGTFRGAVVVAAYYGLCLAPAVAAAAFGEFRVYWLLSSAALAASVVWLWERHRAAKVAAFATNALAAVGNLLLMVSLYVQGTGLNAQFFYHVDWSTLAVAREAFAALAVGGVAYLLLVVLWPRLIPRAFGADRRATRTRTVLAVALAAAMLNTAVVSVAWHAGAGLVRARGIVLVPKPVRTVEPIRVDDPRSLVVVVAESLEATYSRADIFGADLAPALTALAADALTFTDMRQVSHTGWTMGAFVAASCGVPMAPTDYWEQMTSRADARMAGAVCLADVLSAAGYRTVLMVGHPIGFADLDGFAAAHGFAERHGLRSLAAAAGDAAYRSGWGLYDDSLLELARGKLRELASRPQPFALTVMTMDTHFPPGYPSASCGPRPDAGDRAFVIRCADEQIASFVADAREIAPGAVVALYSDHLSQESPRRAGLLPPGADVAAPAPDGLRGIVGLTDGGRDGGPRRLRFSIWDDDRAGATVRRPGTHFDIMPTVLDVLGFHAWAAHGLGGSLLRADSPWFAERRPDRLQILYEVPDVRLERGAEVVFDARGPTVEIGGTRMRATGRGLAFENAAFALAFRATGEAARVMDADALEAALNARAPPFVVGLSSRRSVNRRFAGRDAPLVYFAGQPGRPDFAAAALRATEGPRAVRVAFPAPAGAR